MKVFQKIRDNILFWLIMIAMSPLLLFVWLFGSYLEYPDEYEDF